MAERNLHQLGMLLGRRAEAKAVLADMWSRLAAVDKALAGVRRPRLLCATIPSRRARPMTTP